VRISHLGGHKEEEVGVIWHILIAKLDVGLIVELENVLLQNGFKGWIQRFSNVFQQN